MSPYPEMEMPSKTKRAYLPDPLSTIPRVLTKMYSLWVSTTYPFLKCGSRLSIHPSVDLLRPHAAHIQIGNNVLIAKDAWLNVAREEHSPEPAIIIDDGCLIARRAQISARNSIHLEPSVLLSNSVIIIDHNHAFNDISRPIMDQGVTAGGRIRIEAGCWIGHGAAILCDSGDLVIGHNSIVAVNAVVTRSCPPYSVLSGNPARVVKQYDPGNMSWVLGSIRTGETTTRQPLEISPVNNR